MKRNRWLITLFVIILGIAIVGIANASTIKYAALFGEQNTAVSQAALSQDADNTAGAQNLTPEEKADPFLEACWQLNKAGIDPLLQKAGITRQDIQEAEKLWAQDFLRQNPNLSVQEMAPMHLAWAMGYMQQYRPQVTVKAVNTATAAAQVSPAQTPAQSTAPAPSRQKYQSAPAGHGYHPGHTGQNCNQWPGSGSASMGHHSEGYSMGGHE